MLVRYWCGRLIESDTNQAGTALVPGFTMSNNNYFDNLKNAILGNPAAKPVVNEPKANVEEVKTVRRTYLSQKAKPATQKVDAVEKRHTEWAAGIAGANTPALKGAMEHTKALTQEVINAEYAEGAADFALKRQKDIAEAIEATKLRQLELAVRISDKLESWESKAKQTRDLALANKAEIKSTVGARLSVAELTAIARGTAATTVVEPEVKASVVETIVEPPKEAPVKKASADEPAWSESQLKMINVIANRLAQVELTKGVKPKGLAIKVVTADNKISALTCLKQMPHQTAMLMVEWLAKCNYRKEVWEAALAELPTPKALAEITEEVSTLPERTEEEIPSDEVPSKKQLESVIQDSSTGAKQEVVNKGAVSAPVN